MLEEVGIGMGIAAVAALLLLALQSRFTRKERPYLWVGLIGSLLVPMLNLWLVLVYYGTGDLLHYERTAQSLVGLLQRDPLVYGPEIWRIFLQLDTTTGLLIFGQGNSTGSTSALLAFLFYAFGESIARISLLLGVFSFFSSLAMYRGFRQLARPSLRVALLWACIVLPSGLFWTAAFSKELFAAAGLGWVIYGAYLGTVGGRRFLAVPLVAGGCLLIFLFKTFILIALVAALAAYLFVNRRWKLERMGVGTLSPFFLMVAVGISVVGFLAVGELNPRFSLDSLADEISHGQQAGAYGGSVIEMGPGAEASLANQVAFAPLAIVNSLFRPFIFEAHNVVSLANALETTVLTLLLLLAFKRLGLRRAIRVVTGSPVLLACLVLVFVLAVGVGLASPNLGTLSRYRSPMMPFWVVLVGALYEAGRARRQSGALPRAVIPRGHRHRSAET